MAGKSPLILTVHGCEWMHGYPTVGVCLLERGVGVNICEFNSMLGPPGLHWTVCRHLSLDWATLMYPSNIPTQAHSFTHTLIFSELPPHTHILPLSFYLPCFCSIHQMADPSAPPLIPSLRTSTTLSCSLSALFFTWWRSKFRAHAGPSVPSDSQCSHGWLVPLLQWLRAFVRICFAASLHMCPCVLTFQSYIR